MGGLCYPAPAVQGMLQSEVRWTHEHLLNNCSSRMRSIRQGAVILRKRREELNNILRLVPYAFDDGKYFRAATLSGQQTRSLITNVQYGWSQPTSCMSTRHKSIS